LSKASQIRQRAQEYLRKGNIDKAIEEYKRLVGVESKNPNLFNELGDVFLRAGDRVQAVANYEKAIKNYENVALYNNAIAVCKKILRIVPNRADTIFKLGELRAKQKLNGEAISHFSKFIDTVLSEPGNVAEGIPAKLDAMLQYYPDNEILLTKAAEVFSFLGLKKRAAETYIQLSEAYRNSNDSERARFYMEKFEQIKGELTQEDLAELNEKLASISVEKEVDSEESLEPEESVGPSAPQKEEKIFAPQPQSTSGEGKGSSGIDETVEETEIISAMESSDTREEIEKDEVEEAIDETEVIGAEEELESQLTEDKGEGPFSLNIESETDGSEKKEEDSTVNLATEITSDVDEEDYQSHYDLGMAYVEMGLYKEAVREFQIASRSEHLNLKCFEMIGYCFIKENNPRLAVKQLTRALEFAKAHNLDPIAIHYHLGLAYEMLGETDKAREHFEEVYIVDMGFRDIAERMEKYTGTTT